MVDFTYVMSNYLGVSNERRHLLKKLREAREARGITLAQLKKATHLRLSVVSLSRKLSGKQPATVDELAKIAEIVGLPVSAVRESIAVAPVAVSEAA